MIVVNAFGLEKARKFRRHFSLTEIPSSYNRFGITTDAHDYLHTLTGLLPGNMEHELKILELEEAVHTGAIPMPRGLERV